jgi:hypothetical protein
MNPSLTLCLFNTFVGMAVGPAFHYRTASENPVRPASHHP